MSRYPGRILSSTAPTVSANSAKGIWTLDEAMRYIRAGQWPVPTGNGDPYFQYNTMLLPGQGTNGAQNNTFLDSSTNNFTITRNGNTTQGTFTPFSGTAGNWSNYFDGNGDFLSMTGSSATNFNGTDWTIECWFYKTALSGGNENLIQSTTGTNAWVPYLALGLNNNQTIGVSLNAVGYSSTQTYSLNSWNHIAMVRNGGVVSVYLNGVATSISVTVDIPSTNLSFWIGKVDNAPGGGGYLYYFNGFLSNLRVVKGTAVYTSAFTPPTAPLTAITNTSLLTCQNNRFVDNSTNAFAITPSGNTAVTPFQPFGAPTNAYSASTIGGSGYFDGSGDYLTVADNAAFEFGSGDFTIELWVNTTSSSQYDSLVSKESASVAGAWSLQVNSSSSTSGNVAFWSYDYNSFSAEMVTTTGVSIRDGGWHHVALVRNGSSWVIYIDGVSRGTQTSSVTLGNSSADVWIGNNQSSTTRDLPGYISGLRIVKGTAVYTAGFTPPTAPPIAIANTSLLLNFTNAGIIDNAQDNNLETVGGAQISTTQYKWGASSMYFDGNGDNLSGPSTPALNCGTGDFTIEGWVYVSSRTLNYPVIFGNNNGSYTAGALALTNNSAANVAYNNKFCLNAYDINSSGPPALVSSSTNALNTWYHLALVRVGTTLKMFVNGNQTASATISSSIVFNWGKGGVLVGGGNWDTTNSYFNGYINDLRLTNGYARYQYPFTAPAAPFPLFWQAAATPSADPYFDYTTLLLPGNGTNGANNNTFLDSSTNAFTITRNGNTTQGTFTPFSQTGWSNNFDGNGDYLSCGSNAAISAGSGDFTVEFWLSLNSIGVNDTSLFEARSTNASATGFHIGALALTGGYCINLYTNATANLTSSLIPYRSWTHVAVVRSGSSLRVYINGISELSITNSANFSDTPTFTIGQSPLYASNSLNGDMSNFRMVKGTAVYTSNFVPSTAPLTAIANTQLLTCQSNRFIDNSTNAFTITPNGNVSVQAFSPFNPTAAYSTSTVGGSGYFDASGDYLSISDASNLASPGSGDFTAECWLYVPSLPSNALGASAVYHLKNDTGTSTTVFIIEITSGGALNLSTGTALIAGGTSGRVIAGAWNHLVVSRLSGTLRSFINGTVDISVSNSTTYNGSVVQIGAWRYSTSDFSINGYIGGFRFQKGSGYSSITVPTAPFTAITNTSLLLLGTNGGIIDNTAKNNLETVGGASISTAVSKFGGSSMYFDGTGDYLYRPYSPLFALGTGDFTIEWWMNPDSSQNSTSAIFYFFSGVSYFIAHNNLTAYPNVITVYVDNYGGGTRVLTGTTTLSSGTWHHVAITRYSGVWNLYVNGVLQGSTYTNSAEPVPSSAPLYIGSGPSTGFKGYLQDFRVTKGIARYTTNFTPPTTAFLTL